MTKRLLGKEELENIAWGATVFGAGGGGPCQLGLGLIKNMENEVELFDPADLPKNANVVQVGGIGAPRVASEKPFGPEAINAYEAIKKMASVGGTDIATIKKYLVPGSISRAEEVGKRIRKSKEEGGDAIKEVINITGGGEIFRGKIKEIKNRAVGGFDFGRTIIEGGDAYKDNVLNIDFKNENIIAWKDNEPVAMVPDLIAMMEVEGKPLTNADTKEGMEIAILGIPAPEPWKRIPEGFNCWKPILEKLGYEGPYVPLQTRKEV